MDRKILDRVYLERLECVDKNLEYLRVGESKKQVELLERDARMMKEGINNLYYALLDELLKEG